MPMVPLDADPSTLALTSVLSAAVTFAFCTVSMDAKPGVASGIAITVGLLLYLTGIIPIGLLLLVGVGMAIAIGKKFLSPSDTVPSNAPPSQNLESSSDTKARSPLTSELSPLTAPDVLAPYKSVKEALSAIESEIEKGTQVPVLLSRVFPSMPHAHTHKINTYYVNLRAQGNSKVGALSHALDEYVKAFCKGL
jgi:hypothetical protein